MPISYEAPQPFLPSLSYGYGATLQNNEDAPRIQRANEFAVAQRQQARDRANQAAGAVNALAARNSLAAASDNGIQDAINNRDANAIRVAQFAANQNDEAARFTAGAQQAQNDMRSRFELQAELQQTELSQQELMRLQRMKNQIGEVASDATLTDEEKHNFIVQLKTGINPLEHRIAKAKLAQEQMVKDEMVQQRRVQTAQYGEQLKYMAGAAEDHMYFAPDPAALAQATKDIIENMPGSSFLPREVVGQLARQRVMEQGLGTQMYQTAPGKWVPIKSGEGGAGKGGKGGGEGGEHPSGLDAKAYASVRKTMDAQVRKDAQAMRDNADFTGKVPVYPELATEEGRQKEIEKRLAAAGLPATFTEFSGGRTQGTQGTQTGGYRGIKDRPQAQAPQDPNQSHADYLFQRAGGGSQVGPEGGPASDAAPPVDLSKEKPFERSDPASMTPNQKASIETMAKMREQINLKTRTLAERNEANERWKEAATMLQRAGHPAKMDELLGAGSRRHYLALLAHLDAIANRENTRGGTAPRWNQTLDEIPFGAGGY